jgi:hypothetical protein
VQHKESCEIPYELQRENSQIWECYKENHNFKNSHFLIHETLKGEFMWTINMDLKALVNYTIWTNILTLDIKLGEKAHTLCYIKFASKMYNKNTIG